MFLVEGLLGKDLEEFSNMLKFAIAETEVIIKIGFNCLCLFGLYKIDKTLNCSGLEHPNVVRCLGANTKGTLKIVTGLSHLFLSNIITLLFDCHLCFDLSKLSLSVECFDSGTICKKKA